ncbi:ABC transporter ATP-binding protein [Candidatus Roizmanbacteria bacterium]|nr:ABC transporter ATP-binding protein [Candidatus Roizmanbacteria bacterium]
MHESVLEVSNLYKQFNTFVAVDKISFSIGRGEVVGLLGPNGAGKTTTIQILMGITTPTSGAIHYFGREFEKHRQYCLQRINFTSAFNSLQGRITPYENLKVFAGLYDVKNEDEKINLLTDRLEIKPFMNIPYNRLSSGQKTRVNLAKSLLNDPALVLMDEPTASLDPDIADKLLTFIEELRQKQQLSILYTSHDMKEVTRICDRVIFLDLGKIVAEDTPLGLTKRIKTARLTLTFDGVKAPVATYLAEKNIAHSFPRRQVVSIDIKEDLIPKVIFGLSNRNVWLTDIDIRKPNLEDVFLDIARGGKDELDKN